MFLASPQMSAPASRFDFTAFRVLYSANSTSLDARTPSLRGPKAGRMQSLFVNCSRSSDFAGSKVDLMDQQKVSGTDADLRAFGSGGDGNKNAGGGGGGGGGKDGDSDREDEEFGPIMKYEEIMRETEARGAKLPADMLDAAMSTGIPKVLLLRYLELQVAF